jgi:hypothetical protein
MPFPRSIKISDFFILTHFKRNYQPTLAMAADFSLTAANSQVLTVGIVGVPLR